MSKAFALAVIFGISFAVVGVATLFAWAFAERKDAPDDEGLLRSGRLSTVASLQRLLEGSRFADRLTQLISEANLAWSTGRIVLLMVVGGAAALALLSNLSFVPGWAAFALSCAATAGPILYLRRRRDARLKAVEQQLPEALDYISRAIVAGHSLPMCLELLADESEPPLSIELHKTVDEYNLGLSMEQALTNLGDRLPSVDIQFFTSAIMTQARTGGSLHELLENLSETIRERATLKGQVQALTAHGRISAMVLSLLPIFISTIMLVVNPDYMMILVDHPIGQTLLFLAVCGQVLAFFVIRKIADVQV